MNLRDLTDARLNLGLVGDSLPTAPLLDFRLAHARARDAVHQSVDFVSLAAELSANGIPSHHVRTQASTREQFLRRPDWGRSLGDGFADELAALEDDWSTVFLVVDGLSALAVQRHAAPFLEEVFRDEERRSVILVEQGRVAIGDEVGSVLGAQMSVVLIGERPGLSSPDSLGVYLTWEPRPGRTDAERNCISNIQPNGLSYSLAAHKLLFLMNEARSRKLTGVALKEQAGALPSP
jgi:ethanolamine ammonia-lyase small subunit